MILQVSEASEARKVGDGWRKAANMLAQTSHGNRVRKPAHFNSVKQKYKQCKSWWEKTRNKRWIYGLLVNVRDLPLNKTVQIDIGKKEDRKEAVTEVSMKLCLVFIWQDVILWSLSMKDINQNYRFCLNAGAIELSTLKISTCYSADSVSWPHFISASNFPI